MFPHNQLGMYGPVGAVEESRKSAAICIRNYPHPLAVRIQRGGG